MYCFSVPVRGMLEMHNMTSKIIKSLFNTVKSKFFPNIFTQKYGSSLQSDTHSLKHFSTAIFKSFIFGWNTNMKGLDFTHR